jgi:predicted RNA methylase
MNPTSYHHNLLADHERLAGFKEIIEEKAHGIVYDLGTGSGILASWAAPYSDYVYAVEKDQAIAKTAESVLANYKNVSLFVENALEFVFPEKADIIICEMLDTALIDEEQVPVLNYALKYLKKNGQVIPSEVLNGIELLHYNQDQICYQEHENHLIKIMSPLKIYDRINFKNKNIEQVNLRIKLNTQKKGVVNGIRLTTFTLLSKNIICGPTEMLNPPVIVPIHPQRTVAGESLTIELNYKMGGGLDTIKARII